MSDNDGRSGTKERKEIEREAVCRECPVGRQLDKICFVAGEIYNSLGEHLVLDADVEDDKRLRLAN